MNEFRQDPITGRWVIISALRDARPNHFEPTPADPPTSLGAEACPFCAHQLQTPEPLAHYGRSSDVDWEVCVVPNLYPVVRGVSDAAAPVETTGFFWEPSGTPLQRGAPDVGLHDVVIESPRHVTRVTELTQRQLECMLTAYRDRMEAMRSAGLAFALPWKNSGPRAGASLPHCHSQIVGLPFVPPIVEQELTGSEAYWRAHGSCAFCDLVAWELAAEVRLLAESPRFAAWNPYASRFPFETWVAPKAHVSAFEPDDEDLSELAELLHQVLGSLARHPRIGAFNYFLHAAPFDAGHHDHYHWHLEILPRLTTAAGFEWGTGTHINVVPPEHARSALQELVAERP